MSVNTPADQMGTLSNDVEHSSPGRANTIAENESGDRDLTNIKIENLEDEAMNKFKLE